jgi:DNA-binding transcriptional regulator LsrR (DeoR family)
MALENIAKQDRIGRKQIAERLGIGEGSVRTILNYLKKNGLVKSSRGGHALTQKGKRFLGKPPEFVQVDMGHLAVGKVNVATIVRGAASKVRLGIEQRDEAIKAGADGATVLLFKGGKLRFPEGFFEVKKEISQALMEALKPREGDVIVIGTASDAIRAEVGARAAARSLASSRKV